jgi:hypothetical protein
MNPETTGDSSELENGAVTGLAFTGPSVGELHYTWCAQPWRAPRS